MYEKRPNTHSDIIHLNNSKGALLWRHMHPEKMPDPALFSPS
jgi:hypothetical protein